MMDDTVMELFLHVVSMKVLIRIAMLLLLI